MAGGIAGFVDGVFKGMDWREGRDDRARRRKMEDEEFGWRREDQQWQREDRSYTRSERARARSEREAELAAWNETADQLYGPRDGSATEPQRREDPIKTGPSPSDVLVTQGGLGFGLPRAENDPRFTASTKDEPAKTEPTKPQKRPEGLGRTGAGVGGARPEGPAAGMPPATGGQDMGLDLRSVIESLGQDGVGYQPGQVDPRLAGASGLPGPRPAGNGTAPVPAMAGPVAGRPGVAGSMPAAPEQGPPRGMSILELAAEQSMPQEARDRFNRAQPVAPEAVPLRDPVPVPRTTSETLRQRAASEAAQPQLPPGPAPSNRSTRGVTGDYQGPRTFADGPQDPPRAENASLPQPKAGAKPQPAPVNVPSTPEGTPVESAEVVVQASEKLSFGIAGEVTPPTPAQLTRAVDQAAKTYTREKVPAIVEHYVRTGQLDKAKAFESWMQEKGVQDGMRNWMQAMMAWNVNDGEGVMDGLAATYNSDNYFDDGVTVIREESAVQYDQSGNIVGATVTFQDDATGRKFTQNVSDVRDMVVSVFGTLAPEQAFETAWEMTFGRDKSADAPKKMTAAEATEAVTKAAEQSALTGAPMTPDQQQQMYDRLMAGENPFGSGTASGVGSQIPVYR